MDRVSLDTYRQLQKYPIALILENIRSAQNVGAIFRTADCFLNDSMALCGTTAQPPHPQLKKTALGAENSVLWSFYADVEAAIQHYKKMHFTIVAFEQTTKSRPLQTFTIDATKKYALIFGNEVEGITDQALNLSDVVLEIPQFGTKHSLNVSLSSAIANWEFAKCFIK